MNFHDEVLSQLYIAFSKGESQVGINELVNIFKKNEDEIYDTLVRLQKEEFSTGVTNDSYKILSKGVEYIEENNLASDSIIENKVLRKRILEELLILHGDYGGSQSLYIQEIVDKTKYDIYIVLNNLEILEALGFIKTSFYDSYKITSQGILKAKEIKKRSELLENFKEINKMNPHNRGREFQKFFADLISLEGWESEESVKTSNEEIDVILYRGKEVFFVECKWESKRIETEVVNSFFGKLDNRDGVEGIIISMSDFTKGAIVAVKEHLGRKVIILFNAEDISLILNEDVTFSQLLEDKRKQLISRKKVVLSSKNSH